MKIIIEVKEAEGTTKDRVEFYLKDFLKEINKFGKYNFWNWENANISIE